MGMRYFLHNFVSKKGTRTAGSIVKRFGRFCVLFWELFIPGLNFFFNLLMPKYVKYKLFLLINRIAWRKIKGEVTYLTK